MSNPITWQNIQGRTTVDVGRTMDSAARLLLGAVNNAQQGIQNYDMGQREITKQDFLNTVMAAKTPEEMAALKASGALDAKMAALDPSVQAQVRGADDAYLGSLQKQQLTTNAYNESQLINKFKPVANEAAILAAEGDVARTKALLDANPDMPNRAAILETAIKQRQNNQLLDMNRLLAGADYRLKMSQAKENLAKAAGADSNNYSHQSAASEKMLKDGLYGKGHLGSAEGWSNLTKELQADKSLNSTAKNSILKALEPYRKGFEVTDSNGQKHLIELPVSMLLSQVASSNSPFWINSLRGDDYIGRLRAQLQKPEVIDEILKDYSVLKYRQNLHTNEMLNNPRAREPLPDIPIPEIFLPDSKKKP